MEFQQGAAHSTPDQNDSDAFEFPSVTRFHDIFRTLSPRRPKDESLRL